MTDHTFFAPTAPGLEDLLAEELRALGADRVRAARAGVSFSGPLAIAYRACLWSRTASRVLMRLVEVPANSAEELYDKVRAIRWEEHVAADGSIAVDFTGARSPITHSHYGALKVKDAVVDRFRDRTGGRPDVDTDAPDLRINVAARTRSAVISIDLSGDALHRRGYREAGVQVEAPLKETLAAAILLFGGWPEIAASGGALIDPVCGSGTLLVEGALIAGDRAPGLLRSRWGFDGWLGHDEAAWHELLDEADGRAEAGLAAIPPILGVDIDPRAIEVATACIARAGLAGSVEVRLADLRSLQPPVSQGTDPLPPGLIVANPPYGERIGQGEDLAALYGALGTRAREQFPGYGFALITSDDALAEAVRLPLESTHRVYNGRVPAAVRLFRVPRRSVAVEVSADSMFANRLRKNVRHIGKWARRTATTCYRVYDADMPEYAVAVDRYAGAGPDEGRIWAHVAEYAPPREIDPVAAERRLAEVMAAVPAVLGISPDDVHLKVRTRQKGDAQYERFAARGVFSIVAEDGLLFEVNLTDYLDTGLFLDHRITRGMIREMAEGARFLNLFAYTGAATVHAAAGGARSTLTVDLSATYLEWADHNMALNGFTGPAHVRHRADVLEWIGSSEARDAGPFDLIFCDPPTFSTSKRMESTLDVQRDHAGMLVALEALLAPGGTIVFSNNFRRFRMDHGALSRAGLVATDITAATIPQDFARNPKIHTTWNVTRADER